MDKESAKKEKLLVNISRESDIVWLRWILLILIIPLYLIIFGRYISLYFILIFTLCIVYNFINHLTLIKNIYPSKWFEKNIYIDIMLVSLLILADGGFSSLIYFGYYIFIIYEGIKRKINHPVLLSLITVIIYSTAIYLFPANINLTQLIFRNVFIIFSGILVMEVLKELLYQSKLSKKHYNLAIKDKLTGLYNRNQFEKTLNAYLLECAKHNSSLCIIMFDIDNFELFNDTYGHFTGDELLKHFAKIILESIPPNGKAFRYEGEEFIVVLVNTELKDAYKIAEDIRKKFSSSNVYIKHDKGKVRITVSCGIACCPEHSVGYYELLEYAEKALREAKAEGKNKVVIAEKEEGELI